MNISQNPGEAPMRKISALAQVSCLLLFLLLLALSAVPAAAVAEVGAKYQSVSGNKVVFLVKVDGSPPASLIIQHFHPAGRQLLRASPAADKTGNGTSSSKWFLKSVRPGIYPFSLSYDGPISPSGIRIILRYHDPQTGSYRENIVHP